MNKHTLASFRRANDPRKHEECIPDPAMRYRRVSYRYATVVGAAEAWPSADVWRGERLRLLTHGPWRPDADTYETAGTVKVIVDLSGVEDGDFEVQLFDDALVVEGLRRPPASDEGAVYHVAGIRHGPFRLVVSLAAPIDPERVEALYERGLLRITLPKRAETA